MTLAALRAVLQMVGGVTGLQRGGGIGPHTCRVCAFLMRSIRSRSGLAHRASWAGESAAGDRSRHRRPRSPRRRGGTGGSQPGAVRDRVPRESRHTGRKIERTNTAAFDTTSGRRLRYCSGRGEVPRVPGPKQESLRNRTVMRLSSAVVAVGAQLRGLIRSRPAHRAHRRTVM